MRSSTESWPGRTALAVAHCAGMVDLVALPVWVGALIAQYKLDPAHAGGLATLFLAGAVLSSLIFASRFNRLNGRIAATAGFVVASAAFFLASQVSSFAAFAPLHAAAGAGAACGLSVTHGTIARSANPHRLFAIVNSAVGVFAILFLGATPNLIATFGGQALFVVFGGVMALAATMSALAFPSPTRATGLAHSGAIHPSVWFGVAGVSCMGLNQAMMFSFLERLGLDRGFSASAVTGILIALGFVNLMPAPLAAFLERRVSARAVLVAGPLLQALVIVALTFGSGFAAFAIPAMFLAVMIFTHTFAFGALSRLDSSARALAGTPAMLMFGAMIGPILGGVLVQSFGYPALGVTAAVLAVCAVALFARLHAPATALAPRPGPA